MLVPGATLICAFLLFDFLLLFALSAAAGPLLRVSQLNCNALAFPFPFVSSGERLYAVQYTLHKHTHTHMTLWSNMQFFNAIWMKNEVLCIQIGSYSFYGMEICSNGSYDVVHLQIVWHEHVRSAQCSNAVCSRHHISATVKSILLDESHATLTKKYSTLLHQDHLCFAILQTFDERISMCANWTETIHDWVDPIVLCAHPGDWWVYFVSSF